MIKRKINERKMFFNYYRTTTTEVGWDYRVLIAIHPPRPYGDVTAKENLSVTHAACITNCTRYRKKKILVIFFLNQLFFFQKCKSLIWKCLVGEPAFIHEERRNPNSKTETQDPREIQVPLQGFAASPPTGALACPSNVHPAPGVLCLPPPSATFLPGAVGFVRGALRSWR